MPQRIVERMREFCFTGRGARPRRQPATYASAGYEGAFRLRVGDFRLLVRVEREMVEPGEPWQGELSLVVLGVREVG